jgi:hypothetical protein
MAGVFKFDQEEDADLLSDQERRRLVMQDYRSMSRSQHQQFIKALCNEMPLCFIRDFAVIDTSSKSQFCREPIIYHLPSGLWRSYPCSFAHAVGELKANPDRDHELIVLLHEP